MGLLSDLLRERGRGDLAQNLDNLTNQYDAPIKNALGNPSQEEYNSFDRRINELKIYAGNKKNTDQDIQNYINNNFSNNEMDGVRQSLLASSNIANGGGAATRAFNSLNASDSTRSILKDAFRMANPNIITPDQSTIYTQAPDGTITGTTTLSPDKQQLRADQIGIAQILKDRLLNPELSNDYNALYGDVQKFTLDPYTAIQPRAQSIYDGQLRALQPYWEQQDQALTQQMTNTGLNGASEAAKRVMINSARERTNQMLNAKVGADTQAMNDMMQGFQLRGTTLGQKANNQYNQLSGLTNFASPYLGLSQLLPYNSTDVLGYDTANKNRAQQADQFDRQLKFDYNELDAKKNATWGELAGGGAYGLLKLATK